MAAELRIRDDGFIFNGLQRQGSRVYEHWMSPAAWARKQARRSDHEAAYRKRRAMLPAKRAAYNEYANVYAKEWRRRKPERTLFLAARRRAKASGLPFALTMADIVIPDCCPVFGLPLLIGGGDCAPELDRIVNAAGYVPGNVVVVSRRANRIKNDATLAELFRPDFAKLPAADQIKLIEKPSSPARRIGELFLNKQAMGANLDGSQGTAWGWLNAVTEYIDHEFRSRTADRRLELAWFGQGGQIKERAREVAMEMVTADGSTRTVFQTVAVPPPAASIEQHGSIDIATLVAATEAETV